MRALAFSVTAAVIEGGGSHATAKQIKQTCSAAIDDLQCYCVNADALVLHPIQPDTAPFQSTAQFENFSRSFAAPTKKALHLAEIACGCTQFTGLGATAKGVVGLVWKDKSARNSAAKMLRDLGTAEALDRHFTSVGTVAWLRKLEGLLLKAIPPSTHGDSVSSRRHSDDTISNNQATDSVFDIFADLDSKADTEPGLQSLSFTGNPQSETGIHAQPPDAMQFFIGDTHSVSTQCELPGATIGCECREKAHGIHKSDFDDLHKQLAAVGPQLHSDGFAAPTMHKEPKQSSAQAPRTVPAATEAAQVHSGFDAAKQRAACRALTQQQKMLAESLFQKLTG